MNKEELKNLINDNLAYRSPLGDRHFDLLEKLMNITLKENEKFNLTAIKDENDFRELMIYDSLVPMKYFDFDNKNVLDVGSGAGFPGLPLAISTSGNYTLIDSTNKKIGHICRVIDELKLDNASAVCARAEDYAKDNREKYDYVIARAVSQLSMLVELCLPLVKVGGSFIAMKGANGEEELKEATRAIEKLGGKVQAIKTDQLPLSKEKRILIEIAKVKATNSKYPRAYSEIKSKPL